MPTIFTGRLTLIAAILLAALYCIFPGALHISWWREHDKTLLQKTDLKPGIDMVGGVSLIYEIHAPEGTDTNGLSERVMAVLKKRIDPNGVNNYVWRPQGNTRIEIQVPTTGDAAEVRKRSDAYTAAEENLDATNVRADSVVKVIETMTGDERQKRLKELAMDSQTRVDDFQKMAEKWDQIQKTKSNPDKLPDIQLAMAIQPLTEAYENLKKQIEATNLTHQTLEQLMERKATDASGYKTALDDLKKKFVDFPSRLKAIDAFVSAWDGYQTVKSSVTDATDLKRKLQGSGVLEFHILADDYTVTDPRQRQEIQDMKERLRPDGPGPLPRPGDEMRWMQVDKPEEFDKPAHDGKPAVKETYDWNGKHYMLVLTTPDASMDKSNDKWGLADAKGVTDPTSGQQVCSFSFNPVGGKLFGALTQLWWDRTTKLNPQVHARLAIVLDNKLYSAPNINTPITGGSGEISGGGNGGFDQADLDYLVSTLNAGSLPAQLSSQPVSEEQVGPTLGLDNLVRGLVACGFGLVVVAVFLIGYYYIAGIVAFFAVVMNLVIILGCMAGLGATFTLPCIAGIVLTVGTAVDANVLIFERLREEQHRGLPLKMALRNSYDRAFSAIVDSNMTSAITSVFLYMFGSEEVKGFGLTLLIGICASLFTSLFVTKTIFGIMIEKFGMKHLGSFPLTFPKWDKALKPNWDWMGKAWMFYTFSIIGISIGLVLFVMKVNQGKMMAIEFTSGTSVQFALEKPMPIDDVRKLIEDESRKKPGSLANPSIVAVGVSDQAGSLHYEVVTPTVDREKVKDAVLEAMSGKLHITTPSTFDLVNEPIDKAMGDTVLPIIDGTFSVNGFSPLSAQEKAGGAAIVLRNISPKMTPEDIRSRLDAERLSSGVGGNTIDYTVESPNGAGVKTDFAVIMASNPEVAYSADKIRWQKELCEPLWTLASQAVDRPPSLEKEVNFDAQVAGEMKRDAMLALSFSIVVIMAYIWMRFGNLKYGTATVIALVHDTVFTLAAMGFAHYIFQYWPNNFLQVEPFRIDLTVVAGVLTIMGYSMIDTIVVFDRIRENRGKFGHLNRQVINDAINQTLSRTLLTAGTTIITVSFMYFMGGPGIHGFTFVLLVGILVGSYSSVAIAAPLLLLGKESDTVGTTHAVLGQYQKAPTV